VSARILIAEDDPSIVASLEFLLVDAGYEIAVARNGEEALRVAETFAPELVLLDIMMPVKNGFAVCAEMRSMPALSATKIMMLTARGTEVERDKGLGLGADAYVTKPFSTRELLARIRALVPPVARAEIR